MRHQPRIARERVEQIVVGFGQIDRRQPQPLQIGHGLEDVLHQQAKLGPARETIARDVDAGQHHLAIAVLDQASHLRHHPGHRHRARVSTSERDDAERAAVVAAILHLHECAGVAGKAVEPVRVGIFHRHDVADRSDTRAARRARCPGVGAQLFFVADH